MELPTSYHIDNAITADTQWPHVFIPDLLQQIQRSSDTPPHSEVLARSMPSQVGLAWCVQIKGSPVVFAHPRRHSRVKLNFLKNDPDQRATVSYANHAVTGDNT